MGALELDNNRLQRLKEEFRTIKIEFGDGILKNMSTKTDDGRIFCPYVPFVGQKYNTYKVLVYSTAQNIKYNRFRDLYANNLSKLTERLYYFDDFKSKYPENPKMSFRQIAINPYQTGVLPALLGVFFYAKFGKKIEVLDEINNWIAISNYYKFSLNNGNKDINPEAKKEKMKKYIGDHVQVKDYWRVNDDLVKMELNTLSPDYILSFNGRKLSKLNAQKKGEVIPINDPSWILQGAGGALSENRSWWQIAKRVREKEINDLIDTYLDCVQGNYKGKKDSIRVYLLKYYSEWRMSDNTSD